MKKFKDRGYKKLFSHPRMIEDLFNAFIKEDFVSEIDFTSLKRVNNSFVTDNFKDREADIIWKTKFKDKNAYIFILIEFQSTVDKFMPLRMLTYILLFYQELLKKSKTNKLPAVFPVLLYNGEKKWTAPEKIEDLIEMPFTSIKPYIPKFKYYKIAENEFEKESLEKLNNLTAQLFNIENSSVNELDDVISKLLTILKTEVPRELQRDFGLWLRQILRIRNSDFDIGKLDEMEVKPMLAEEIKRFEKEVIREEVRKGKLEGKIEGKIEGKMEERHELARKLVKMGVDIDIIARATDMSESEIKKMVN